MGKTPYGPVDIQQVDVSLQATAGDFMDIDDVNTGVTDGDESCPSKTIANLGTSDAGTTWSSQSSTVVNALLTDAVTIEEKLTSTLEEKQTTDDEKYGCWCVEESCFWSIWWFCNHSFFSLSCWLWSCFWY